MPELTPKELKLLALALDKAAQPGERATSSLKFFESLCNRGVSSHELEAIFTGNGDSGSGVPPKMSKPDYGLCKMPFGKTKGQLFMDLPPYDLRNAQRWAKSTPELEKKFSQFIADVDEFFKQGR
jgi:hypothetical protein